MNNSITAISIPVIGCVVLLTADDNVVESTITVNKGMVILDFKKSVFMFLVMYHLNGTLNLFTIRRCICGYYWCRTRSSI